MSGEAFQASYADFRTVKSRRVVQIILEVPLEKANEALTALGGVPTPDGEVWVGVARLNKSGHAPSSVPKRKFDELLPQTQAGIIANEAAFWKFAGVASTEEAAQYIRNYCGVKSRSEINESKSARYVWDSLLRQYEAWKIAG